MKTSDFEFQLQISPLNTSLTEEDYSNSQSFGQYLLSSSLTPKYKSSPSVLGSPQEALLKSLQSSSLKIRQLEIDLEFYIEQLRITTEENENLRRIIQEKDKIIQELASSQDFSLTQQDLTLVEHI